MEEDKVTEGKSLRTIGCAERNEGFSSPKGEVKNRNPNLVIMTLEGAKEEDIWTKQRYLYMKPEI